MSLADEAVAVVIERRLACREAQTASEACAQVCHQARKNLEAAQAELEAAEKALLQLGQPSWWDR